MTDKQALPTAQELSKDGDIVNENAENGADRFTPKPSYAIDWINAGHDPVDCDDAYIYGLIDPDILARPLHLGFSPEGVKTFDGRWKEMKTNVRDLVYGNLVKHPESKKKDGWAILQGPPLGGARKATSIPYMDILALDLDTGEDILAVARRIAEMKLLAVLYSTHSSGKDITAVKRDTVVKHSGGDDAAAVCRYLREAKRVQSHVLEGAEIVKTEHTSNGTAIYLRHQPMEKFRVVFFLKARFIVGGRAGTDAEGRVEWAERYAGVSEQIGAFYDRSCTDVSRLFYLPCHAPGGEHNTIVLAGDLLDLDTVPRVKKGRDGDVFGEAAKAMGASGEEFKTAGLKAFAAKWGRRFEIVDMMNEMCPYDNRGSTSTGDGAVFKCPNDDAHSNAGEERDSGFHCTNASDIEDGGFVAKCKHDACQDIDRLGFVDLLCQEHRLTADDLLKWRYREAEDPEEEEPAEPAKALNRKAARLAMESLPDKDDDTYDDAKAALLIGIAAGMIADPVLIRQSDMNDLAKDAVKKFGGNVKSWEADINEAAKALRLDIKKAAAVKPVAAGSVPEWREESPLDPEAAIDWMNERYAASRFGTDFVVFDLRDPEPLPLSKSTVSDILADRDVMIPGDKDGEAKPALLFAHWWRSKRRLAYKRTVFKPSGIVTLGDFNLWRGWAIEAAMGGDYSLFRHHLFYNVCRGDPMRFAWVWCWVAQMVQDPETKMGTALALTGGKGVGKSIISVILGRLMPHNHQVVSAPDEIFGGFNAHLGRALLTVIEEAFWAGNHEAEGRLKHMITSPTMLMTPKGIDSQKVDDRKRLMIFANADWVVPATQDERRYTVLSVGADRQYDHDYFGAIDSAMEPGSAGLAGFFYDLQHTRIPSWVNLRHNLKTRELRQQADHNLPTEDDWAEHLVHKGCVTYQREGAPVSDPWENGTSMTIQTECLYDDYTAFCRGGSKKPKNVAHFGRWLQDPRQAWLVIGHTRIGVGGASKTPGYDLHSLESIMAARPELADGGREVMPETVYPENYDEKEGAAWAAFGHGGALPA